MKYIFALTILVLLLVAGCAKEQAKSTRVAPQTGDSSFDKTFDSVQTTDAPASDADVQSLDDDLDNLSEDFSTL